MDAAMTDDEYIRTMSRMLKDPRLERFMVRDESLRGGVLRLGVLALCSDEPFSLKSRGGYDPLPEGLHTLSDAVCEAVRIALFDREGDRIALARKLMMPSDYSKCFDLDAVKLVDEAGKYKVILKYLEHHMEECTRETAFQMVKMCSSMLKTACSSSDPSTIRAGCHGMESLAKECSEFYSRRSGEVNKRMKVLLGRKQQELESTFRLAEECESKMDAAQRRLGDSDKELSVLMSKVRSNDAAVSQLKRLLDKKIEEFVCHWTESMRVEQDVCDANDELESTRKRLGALNEELSKLRRRWNVMTEDVKRCNQDIECRRRQLQAFTEASRQLQYQAQYCSLPAFQGYPCRWSH